MTYNTHTYYYYYYVCIVCRSVPLQYKVDYRERTAPKTNKTKIVFFLRPPQKNIF